MHINILKICLKARAMHMITGMQNTSLEEMEYMYIEVVNLAGGVIQQKLQLNQAATFTIIWVKVRLISEAKA